MAQSGGSQLSFNERRGFHLERLSEFLNDGDRWVPRGTLNVADISPVNPSTIGKVLLAPALLGP